MSKVCNSINKSSLNSSVLISTTNYLDSEVCKVASEVSQIAEDGKANETKPINKILKACGKKREEKKVNIDREDEGDLEREGVIVEILSDDAIKEIKGRVEKNPITKDMVDKAKQFFHDNVEEVEKQMRDLVALYNIKDRKPFFFISPSEARLAINYIKGVRDGFIQDKEEEVKKDKLIKGFISKYRGLLDEYNSVPVWEYETNQGELIGDISKDIVNGCLKPLYFNISKVDKADSETSLALEINWLSCCFALVEAMGEGCVDAIIMNAFRYADIRKMGQSIYEESTESTVREVKERGVFGRIWTADIYVSKEIPNDTIITVSSDSGIFINNKMRV